MDWLHKLRRSVGLKPRPKASRPATEIVVPISRESSRWLYDGTVVEASTRSEARAKLKKVFGLKRLPIGAKIERVA